jgi:hypothetical protein
MPETIVSLLIVALEIALGVAVAAVLVATVLTRRKAQRAKLLDALAHQIEENEPDRHTGRIALLQQHFGLEESAAGQISAQILDGEKAYYDQLLSALEGEAVDVTDMEGALSSLLNRALTAVSRDALPPRLAMDQDSSLEQLREQNAALNEENERLVDEVAELKGELDKMVREYTNIYDKGGGPEAG